MQVAPYGTYGDSSKNLSGELLVWVQPHFFYLVLRKSFVDPICSLDIRKKIPNGYNQIKCTQTPKILAVPNERVVQNKRK